MRLRQASTVCRRCISRLVRRAGAVSRLPLRTGVVSYSRRRVGAVSRFLCRTAGVSRLRHHASAVSCLRRRVAICGRGVACLLHRVGAVSCLRRRVRFVLRKCAGQGSVEYALVLFAFLGVIAGLGLLGNVLDAGVLIEHALQSASHHLSSAAPGALSDVFMY